MLDNSGLQQTRALWKRAAFGRTLLEALAAEPRRWADCEGTRVTEAEQLVAEGYERDEAGDSIGAERLYRAAAEANPQWSVPFYNLGLMCKYQARWPESLTYNQRAAALAPDDEASWWNLGIAATALGDWSEARRAWSACGIDPPPGDGPPLFEWGRTPVRLDPSGDAEVVWAQRLDPARARIISVPLPWSAHNFGDIVLNDGAPQGHRRSNGVEYPVFNVLALLEPSKHQKFVVELGTSDPASVEALEDIASALGGAVEDWGVSTNILCAQCSLGTPHEHSDAPAAPAHPHCGLAAFDRSQAEMILGRWLDEQPRADLIRWYAVHETTA